MADYVLKEYTQEEREADMYKELAETSLYNCVKLRCDLIDDECVSQQMGYISHRCIQEFMCEILDLIELSDK